MAWSGCWPPRLPTSEAGGEGRGREGRGERDGGEREGRGEMDGGDGRGEREGRERDGASSKCWQPRLPTSEPIVTQD